MLRGKLCYQLKELEPELVRGVRKGGEEEDLRKGGSEAKWGACGVSP